MKISPCVPAHEHSVDVFYSQLKVTKEYLRSHPNEIFVFGDNLQRSGHGGAASLRDEPNTYGFITKKAPNNLDSSFFRAQEYMPIYQTEIVKLIGQLDRHPHNTYLISKLGAGLANKYKIFDYVIGWNMKKQLEIWSNVRFLW